jgi:hypothetical protein
MANTAILSNFIYFPKFLDGSNPSEASASPYGYRQNWIRFLRVCGYPLPHWRAPVFLSGSNGSLLFKKSRWRAHIREADTGLRREALTYPPI